MIWPWPWRKHDLVLNSWLSVTADAVNELISAEAGAITGVSRARARLRGRKPALRLVLWLTEDTDPHEVRRSIEADVLPAIRSALGITTLPTTLRLKRGQLLKPRSPKRSWRWS
ncbi:hypothetical protein NLX83_26135 [Allokutzneria sp. A3M-2-11 16]|uniref:hypothetical protein n=1 Tax=Allokutzneria sp. A3M-2-11 16 TaxID=2962043 RepID=UPI0020B7DB7B|nr:hypothetical protein [Allokutzneria sp. A3M-2-11 16]MCP3802758.1 hypothetical protein [Allokutzneria sp. A3M-2-11 16]